MKFKHVIIVLFFLQYSVSMISQTSKWILGNSQQTSSGSFYSLTTGNLHFFEVDFTSSPPIVTPRIMGNSISNIISMGSQDVINNATDGNGNVQFYLFSASKSAYNNFSGVLSDTVYFVAFDSTTGKDEVFGKVAAENRISSVIEHGLCPRPGFNGQYYFIYKTKYASNSNDDIRYVVIDGINHTVSTPITIVNDEKNGEGFSISPYDCANNRYWLYTTRLEANGFVTIRRTEIGSSGLTGPIDLYTINITNNSSGAVITAIEISPTGNTLAACLFTSNSNKVVSVFDLDIATGNITNERFYTNASGYGVVTCEFSPDGNRIYIMQGGSSSFPNIVYNCPVISSGSHTLNSSNQISSISISASLAMELAYDGKIYVNKGKNKSSFYCIENPNSNSPTITSSTSPFFGTTTYRIGDAFPDQIDGLSNPINQGYILASDTSICKGETVTLTASMGDSYYWNGGTIDSTSTINVSPDSTTIYFLEVLNGSCLSYDTITLKVDTIPIAIVSGNTSICSGDTIVLYAFGGNSYQWTGNTMSDSSSIIINPDTTSFYTVTPSNSGCQGQPVNITVNVTPLPDSEITTNATTICDGQTLTLTANGGLDYQWSGGVSDTASIINTSPSNTTIYYLTAYNGFCEATDSIIVNVDTMPIGIVSGSLSICSDENTTLIASGAESYQWSGGAFASTSTITASPGTSTTYILTPINGVCIGNQISVFVNVTQKPNALIIASDSIICFQDTIKLKGTGGTNYEWSGGITSNLDSINIIPTLTTTYFLEVSNGSCTDTDSITIIVDSIPLVSINGDLTICEGQTATLVINGATSYQWLGFDSISGNTLNVIPSQTTPYIVIPSNGSCIGDSITITVQVNPHPTASITSNETTSESIINFFINNSSFQNTNCITYFGDGDSIYGCSWPELMHTYTQNGNYIANTVIIDTNSCSDTSFISLTINKESQLFIPNAFTPNCNGINDFFNIYGTGIENIKFIIFNRWGELIFESDDLQKGWDGKYKGKLVEAGVYVWKLDFKSTATQKSEKRIGKLTIIR